MHTIHRPASPFELSSFFQINLTECKELQIHKILCKFMEDGDDSVVLITDFYLRDE